MKTIYYLLAICFAISGCEGDILDKEPINLIGDNIVFDNPQLVDMYINGIYPYLPVMNNDRTDNDAGFEERWGNVQMILMADEATSGWDGHQTMKHGEIQLNPSPLDWYTYVAIRRLNQGIENLEKNTKGALSPEFVAQRIGEMRFLRAFAYFSMVKRYGGVPLITRVQQLSNPVDELYPKREKESVLYDFIISEADACAETLPEYYDASEYGRPSKIAALALKSRAAMYAASIATWGKGEELDGIVGIGREKAELYWQQSFEASKAIIDYSNGNPDKLSLYNKYPLDKTKNYRQLFLEQNNPEGIWMCVHLGAPGRYVSYANNWNLWQQPSTWHPWGGGHDAVVYKEFVDEYEDAGSTTGRGRPIPESVFSGIHRIDDVFANKDPRLLATVYTENTLYEEKGRVRLYAGIIKEDGSVLTTASATYKDLTVTKSGQRTPMGLGVLKFTQGTEWPQPVDDVIFRYGEILLNYAEACFELGKADQVIWAVNEIRRRAGLGDLETVNREQIRHERKIELAFESNRYWDLRRWRIATDVLNEKEFTTLQYYVDYQSYVDEGGTANDPEKGLLNAKYQVIKVKAERYGGTVSRFAPNHYYVMFTPGQLSNNYNLVQNPGYSQ